ncbi:unnamed protein product, partial [Mesorhabditis spiculigera]
MPPERAHLRRGPNSTSSSSTTCSMISDPGEIELREQLERDKIVAMYDRGPDNPHIANWERSEWEGFKRTDRFGFVQRDNFVFAQETPKRKSQDVMPLSVSSFSLVKWKNWFGKACQTNSEFAYGRSCSISMLSRLHTGKESELLARARLISKHVKQIDLDVGRTYRHHAAFRRRYDVKQQSLFNLLVAYSVFNTEIGYCQGMSQIGALLLMFLDEEDAFWCLHSLMISPRHTMHGFFVTGFPKLQRFESHFRKILKHYKPKVYDALEKEAIPYFFVTKWWFGCFLDRVPFPLALRIWDVYILYGDEVLMGMALNIMDMHEKTIRNLSLEKFMEFVQSGLANDFGFTDDEAIQSLRNIVYKLKKDRKNRPAPPEKEEPLEPLGAVLEETMMDIHERVHEVRLRQAPDSCSSNEANDLDESKEQIIVPDRCCGDGFRERLIV